MFCEKCGKPVGDFEKFCGNCGAPVLPLESAEAVSVEAEAKAAAESVSVEAEAKTAAESVSAEAETKAAAESVSVEAEAKAAAEAVSVEAEAKTVTEPTTVSDATMASETTAVSATPEPAVSLAIPQVQEAPIAPAIPMDNPNDSGKKPKKKKAPWIIAVCAVLAAVVVVICVACGAGLGNFFRRNFSSPEQYYQYVEGKTVSALAEMCGAYYEALIIDSLGTSDRSVDAEFTIELGEGGKELIKQLEMADVDLAWLTDVSMGVGYTLKNSLLGYDLSFGLNKSDILSVKAIADLEGGTMYLQVPELTVDYIGVDLNEITDGDWTESLEAYKEMQETLVAVQKAMPKTKDVEKLLQKYLKLALSGVSDVEKSTKTIKVEGVQQKCTELEVTFDGKSLSKILKAVLKEIPKDKDLKNLFVSTTNSLLALDGDWTINIGEDAWDEFIEEVEELLDNLDELEDLDEVLVMRVYVDGKGDIVGRVIELVEDKETYATISVLMPKKGSSFGYEFSVEPGYGTKIALTGSGKISGSNLTGDFALEVMGMSILDIKVSGLDTKQLRQGYLNGSVTIAPSRLIGSLLTGDMSYNGTRLTDMQLTLDFQSSKDFDKMTMGLLCDKEEMFSAVLSVKSGDGSGISVPDAGNTVFVEETDDLQGWLDEINWDKFIENLDKAGLPDEIVDAVEDIAGVLAGQGLPDGLYGYDYDDYFSDDYFSDDYFGDDYFGDDYFGDDYFGDDYFSDDYFGDDYYGDDHYGDDHYGDDHYGDDHYGDDTYGSNLGGDENSLEQLLQSDEWQSELKSWNDSVAEMGISIDTVADGNTLVFEYHLPDETIYNAFGETEGSLMADAFLGTLNDADFINGFGMGYGIWLNGVRCVIFRADGTEIYSDEIRYEY